MREEVGSISTCDVNTPPTFEPSMHEDYVNHNIHSVRKPSYCEKTDHADNSSEVESKTLISNLGSEKQEPLHDSGCDSPRNSVNSVPLSLDPETKQLLNHQSMVPVSHELFFY